MKTCFKCGCTKPLDLFYKHIRMKDGRLNKCIDCTKQDVHEHRHGKGRESVLAYDKLRYQQNETRKSNVRASVQKARAKNPERMQARNKVEYAVKHGLLQKQPCFICGAEAEAHHPDYSRPLDVVWLCSSHHKQAHALEKYGVVHDAQIT